jgi:hypothetical protein
MHIPALSRFAAHIKCEPKQFERARQVIRFFGLEWEHWSRVVLNRTLAEFVRQLDFSQMKALEISGDHWRNFGFRSYRSIDFPEYDVRQEPLEREAFDLIFAEQVFEHIRAPRRAAENVCYVLVDTLSFQPRTCSDFIQRPRIALVGPRLA